MDKSELKVRALLERISEITTTHENRNADLRVEITTQAQTIDELRNEVERLNSELAATKVDSEDSDVPTV